jgi:K+-transporting ATPase ATPase A chain
VFDVLSLWTVVVVFGIVLALAPYLGSYFARVFLNRPAFGDAFWSPIERTVYRLMGTDPRRSMRSTEYFLAVVLVNGMMWAWLYGWFAFQSALPLNPLGIAPMAPDLAFHSASSFTTNTDFVHFIAESQTSEGVLLLAVQLAMFLSAATGLSVVVAFIRGFVRKDGRLGNFYVDLVRAVTRILLPLSLLGSLALLLGGVPQTFHSSVTFTTLTGGSQTVLLGPVASFQSISLVGSNGGGWYASNMASPYANPSELTNLFALGLMLVLPLSAPFTFAQLVRRPGEGLPYVGTTLAVLTVAVVLFLLFQSGGNPDLNAVGAVAPGSNGYPVGQETRFSFGSASAFQVVSVYANVGANNMALGSLTPGAQLSLLFGMFTQATPGGVGTGFGTLLIYALLAVFVGGLMVGRTPEYLGKKIGQSQVRWAAVVLLVHPLLVLIPLAVAVLGGFDPLSTGVGPASASSVPIQSHNFTIALYEFTSESSNNGSAMAPINDTTIFFNLAGGLVMLLGRFLPILAMLKVGGLFAEQDVLPPGPGTLKTRSLTFTLYLFFFVIVMTGLLFLPVIALGPLSQMGF